ncbi:MAG: ATP-NAD kinase family protein [Spirochaetales bacterium]|nr:ATP-NAD kinase family protein [Spirochaetales bacterium]
MSEQVHGKDKSSKVRIGLIVNPVAGMGGSVGLKGTDGAMSRKALELGASPVTPVRAREFLGRLRNTDRIELLTAPGKMGAKWAGGSAVVVGATGETTTAEDTRRIAREMVSRGIELLVFVGGDGTARDIQDSIGMSVPVIAVPAGVKVFSGVFAVSPGAAAAMLDAFLEGNEGGEDSALEEQEVLDIDEEAFRQNRLASKLYGYLLAPRAAGLLQRGKEASSGDAAAVQSKEALAAYVAGAVAPGVLYLLGPGTTVKAVADALGLPKTLLGVDAVAEGRLVGSDLGEKGILELMDRYEETRIIVTPIGGNGFLFGRGNRQFTPEVLRRVGREGILVVATSDKLTRLEALRVDTGDSALDQALSGYVEVVVGTRETMKMEVRC